MVEEIYFWYVVCFLILLKFNPSGLYKFFRWLFFYNLLTTWQVIVVFFLKRSQLQKVLVPCSRALRVLLCQNTQSEMCIMREKLPNVVTKWNLFGAFFINNVELSLLKGFVESSWTLNVFFFFNFKQDNNFYINNKMYLLSSINRMGNYSWFVISSSETAFGLHWIQIKQFEQIR